MKNSDRQYFFQYHKHKHFIREWGDPDLQTVLFIHGFPGCADQAKLLNSSQFKKQPFRLISIDRPGYGQSDFQPHLTPLEFGRQIKRFLDTAQIEKVSIITVSGGAPYGFALAYLLKDRVQSISSVGGIAPLNIRNFRLMNAKQKKAWLMRNLVPAPALEYFLEKVFKEGAEKLDELLFSNLAEYSEPDQKVFANEAIAPILLQTIQDSLAQGPSGILHDMKVYSRSWGFPLSEIKCPVKLWHGTKDDVVSIGFAESMKAKIPHAQFFKIDGEGHYSLPMNKKEQIIHELLSHA